MALRADHHLVRPIRRGSKGLLNQFATTYLKARWYLGVGLMALTIVIYATGLHGTYTWVVAVAGAVIVAHAFAMTMWDLHDARVALFVDLTAAYLAASILGGSSGDHIPTLLTLVGASVLIGLFSDGWERVAIVVYSIGFTLVSLLLIEEWDFSLVVGDFIGVVFVVTLIIGVISAIRSRLVEVEAARAQTIAVVSHELRNHLAGVIGAAELIREDGAGLSPEEVDELLGMAHQQSLEAAEVIEDLLVASRAERGVLDSIPELLDLCPLTDSVVRRTSIEHRGILFDCVDWPVWAVADPLRYKQILRNLLTNALRYGGETIRVSVQRLGDLVSVIVADDGAGVDASDVPYIFQPYRGGKQMAHTSGSSGLGLWIARSLAEKMDGALTYRRHSGQTLFELTLPAGEGPSQEPEEADGLGYQPTLLV
jgi:signal transduction histidine kinase